MATRVCSFVRDLKDVGIVIGSLHLLCCPAVPTCSIWKTPGRLKLQPPLGPAPHVRSTSVYTKPSEKSILSSVEASHLLQMVTSSSIEGEAAWLSPSLELVRQYAEQEWD